MELKAPDPVDQMPDRTSQNAASARHACSYCNMQLLEELTRYKCKATQSQQDAPSMQRFV